MVLLLKMLEECGLYSKPLNKLPNKLGHFNLAFFNKELEL